MCLSLAFVVQLKELVERLEPLVFDVLVRLKPHPEVPSSRFGDRRSLASAIPSEEWRVTKRTVTKFHVVKVTLVARLQVEVVTKVQPDTMTFRR